MEMEAIYQEGGILKLPQELPLQAGQKVRVTVHDAMSRAKQSQGLVPFKGSPEDWEYAVGPENHPWNES